MKLRIPFVTRARMDRELAAVREEARQEAEQVAARSARKLAEAVAANMRLDDRRRELGRRLDAAHDMELGELADVSALEARAVQAEARARQLEKDVDRLQPRLDDAVGLSGAAYDWRRVLPKPAKEDAS